MVYDLLQFMLALIKHSPDIYIDEIQKQLLDLHNVNTSLSVQETYNPIIKKLLKWKRKTILVLVAFTVLKQFVHLVVLHEPSLQNLSHQQRFWSSWQTHIQIKPQDQITYALIRHVRFLEPAFKMEAGIHRAILAVLLLMLIIISIIELQIGCAEHIAIQHLLMD